MLGKEQWAWLESELKKEAAVLRSERVRLEALAAEDLARERLAMEAAERELGLWPKPASAAAPAAGTATTETTAPGAPAAPLRACPGPW